MKFSIYLNRRVFVMVMCTLFVYKIYKDRMFIFSRLNTKDILKSSVLKKIRIFTFA